MFFSVPVPGFGDIFVDTATSSLAVSAVRQFLNRNRIQLEAGSEFGEPRAVGRARVIGELVLDSAGFPAELEEPSTPPSAAVEPHVIPAEDTVSTVTRTTDSETIRNGDGVPVFVGKVVNPDGSTGFVRVEATNTSAARAILESSFGDDVHIAVVSTPQFLLETDHDFRSLVGQAGGIELGSFVRGLSLIVEQASSDQDPSDGAGPTVPQVIQQPSSLPIDVQSFPFASFQNAVAELGIDPEGALGSTVGHRFDDLAPAAQIGSLTGTVAPIGQAPGALEQFFLESFGDLDVAAETFRDLLAGRTAGDAGAEDLLALRSFRNPDIGTAGGRADAADVFRLARAAAGDRFGSFVASRVLPSNARLFRELERQLATGDAGTNFLQFARQQNLLPA